MRRLVCALIGLTAGPAAAQTDWQTGSGNWATAANWSAGVPTAATAATIAFANGGSPYTVTVNSPAAAQLLFLNSAAATVSVDGIGTSLDVLAAEVTAGRVRFNGGTLNLTGTSSSRTFAGSEFDLSNGRLNLAGQLFTDGSLVLGGGGVVGGTGRVRTFGPTTLATAGGSFRITDTAEVWINAGVATAGTPGVSSGGSMVIDPGATFFVAGSSEFRHHLDNPSFVQQISGGGRFWVNGTFVKSGPGRLDLGSGLQVIMEGTTVADGGTLRIINDGNTVLQQYNFGAQSLNGTWRVNDGGALDLGGRQVVEIRNGSVTLNGPTASFPDLAALTTISGRLTLTGGQAFTPTAASVGVNFGILEVGAGSTFGRDVSISRGTLTGAGTVSGRVTASTLEVVRPGDGSAVGTLTVAALEFASSGQFSTALEIRGGAAANSKLALTGATPLTPTSGADVLTLRLTDDGSLVPGTPYTWTVIEATNTITGLTAANFQVEASNFTLAGVPLVEVLTNQVRVTFVPVPEPAGLLLVAAGAWLVRRRRRRDAGNPQRPRFPGAVTAGPVEFRQEAGAVLARPGPAEPLCPWEPALARERIDQLSAAGGGVTPAEVWKRMGVS
jgi:hypothetical protein